jgi:hypothetical protein
MRLGSPEAKGDRFVLAPITRVSPDAHHPSDDGSRTISRGRMPEPTPEMQNRAATGNGFTGV